MEFKDCVYYSKKMNIGKKNEARSTVFGFVVSFLLLSIFLLFSGLIIYIESSINENHNIASVYFNYSNEINDECIIGNYVEDKLNYYAAGVEFNTIHEGFSIKEITAPTITIGDSSYKYADSIDNIKISGQNILCYQDNNLVLDSEEEYLKKNKLGSSILAGEPLKGNKKEIMVSSYMLNYFGIKDYNSVIGSNISFYNQLSYDEVDYGYVIDGEFVDDTASVAKHSYYVFKDYKIVGVFNSNIYLCPSRLGVYNKENEEEQIKLNANFWVSSNSIKEHTYDYYKFIDEKGYEHVNQNKHCYSYNLIEELNNNTDRIQIINFKDNTLDNNSRFCLIQFKSVKALYDYMTALEDNYDYYSVNMIHIMNSDLNAYYTFYPYFEFLKVLIIIVVTLVLLLVSLNIIRIMDYSLSNNIDFFMMMNTLGLEKKDIKNIYLIKNVIDCIKSILISLSILIPLDILVALLLKNLYANQFRGWLDFNIPIYYYILSILIPIVLIFGIIYLISIGVIKSYNNKSIKRRIN